jgi:hypothetical protein
MKHASLCQVLLTEASDSGNRNKRTLQPEQLLTLVATKIKVRKCSVVIALLKDQMQQM